MTVVIATTKVRIFKQITTGANQSRFLECCYCYHKGTYFQANHNYPLISILLTLLLLLPQRYVFSSKSQPFVPVSDIFPGCYCYHKGTYFQANHNTERTESKSQTVVIATTKVRIFKQITTGSCNNCFLSRCYCYHKGTYFQANHNLLMRKSLSSWLLLLPQRYVFSSKSQRSQLTLFRKNSCYCYHKGTYFQANHNLFKNHSEQSLVVIATTKVRIFKQITTANRYLQTLLRLLLLPQRYVFSSKSQRSDMDRSPVFCCYCYHKGTYFQANHNKRRMRLLKA